MRENLHLIICLLTYLFFLGCHKKIYPDRSQFIRDGGEIPSIDLSQYKSVQERPNQRPDWAVAMAISGGGSRAANFSIGIMLGLEEVLKEEGINVLNEVDYLSTVSGGGFAGGAYVSALYEHTFFENDVPFSLRKCVRDHIRNELNFSYSSVLLKANINPRNIFSYLDDGDELERTIDNHVLGYKRRKHILASHSDKASLQSLKLGDFFIDKNLVDKPVQFPMIFANCTILGKWIRLPFTPDILQAYQINGFTHRLRFHRYKKLNLFEVPLAVGIKASGSFPVLIANTTLSSAYNEERPYLHILDGGLSDNTGYETAIEVLQQDIAPLKVMLLVDADNIGNRYTFSEKRGAVFSLNVFSKLPYSGLDAKRAIIEREVQNTCKKDSITPVFLSFNLLIKNDSVPMPPEIHLKKKQQELIEKLRKDYKNISEQDQHILYELLTVISTKYSIEKEEQALLMLAGQAITWMQREEILKALKLK